MDGGRNAACSVLAGSKGIHPKRCNHTHRKLKKGALSKLHEELHQDAPAPIHHSVWKGENEAELAKLKSGDVEDALAQCRFQQSLDLDAEELTTRLKGKGPRRHMKVITVAF